MKNKTKKIFTVLIIFSILFSTFVFATEENNETKIEPRTAVSDEGISNETQTYVDPETGEEYDISLLNEDKDDYYEGDSEEYIDGDLYNMDNSVDVKTDVNGNVFVMGETVNFENIYVEGDVFVLAKKVNFNNSIVNGSVFALAQEIKFDANAYDVYALGEKVIFSENSYIGRTVRASAKKLELNGNIDANAYITAENLVIGDDTIISGKLSYTSEKAGDISEKAQIGSVEFNQSTQPETEATAKFFGLSILMEAVSYVFKVAIISALIIAFCNRFVKISKEEKVGKTLIKSLGSGALALILTPCIALALICTVIGTGFGIVLMGAYAIVLFFASAIASTGIAVNLFNTKINSKLGLWGASLGTALVIWCLGQIPAIGWLISLFVILIGLGLLTKTIFYKENDKKVKGKKDRKVAEKENKKEKDVEPIKEIAEDKKEAKKEENKTELENSESDSENKNEN